MISFGGPSSAMAGTYTEKKKAGLSETAESRTTATPRTSPQERRGELRGFQERCNGTGQLGPVGPVFWREVGEVEQLWLELRREQADD